MQRLSSLIVTLYDEENQLVTVCCTICGATTMMDVTFEMEDEEEGTLVSIDHAEGCELALSYVLGKH